MVAEQQREQQRHPTASDHYEPIRAGTPRQSRRFGLPRTASSTLEPVF